jgi:NTE family protein
VIRRLLALALCLAALGSQAAAQCRFEPPPPAPPITLPAGTRIGLALGSGSMHGYAHVGVLTELEARALPVDVVAGTSVGALVGSLWASGMPARQIATLANREDLDFASPAGSWQGLYTNDPMRALLDTAFAGRPIESWPRRFGAVATNVANGERRVMANGDGTTAVRASSAMPVMFLPVVFQGERLVDGALVEPVPVTAARDLGANVVIAVDIAYRPGEEEASGITAYAFQALHILVNSLAASQARDADVLIRLNLHKRWTECGREGLVAAGRAAVAQAWPEIARALLARAAADARPK